MNEPTKADKQHAYELWQWCIGRASTLQLHQEDPFYASLRKKVQEQFANMTKSLRQHQDKLDELECLLAQKEEEEEIVLYPHSPTVHSASPSLSLRGGAPDDD